MSFDCVFPCTIHNITLISLTTDVTIRALSLVISVGCMYTCFRHPLPKFSTLLLLFHDIYRNSSKTLKVPVVSHSSPHHSNLYFTF